MQTTTRCAVDLVSVMLAFALTLAPDIAAATTPCPDVDSARARLAQAAAEENTRALKAARQRDDAKATGKQVPGGKGPSAPSAPQATPPPAAPEALRAAALVKEAETACQNGDKAAASEKARAAIGLIDKR